MKKAVADLLSSKKFVTAIVALLVLAGAKFGLNLDPELLVAILGIFAVLIGAQGAADMGKEAAKVHVGASAEPASNVTTGSIEGTK